MLRIVEDRKEEIVTEYNINYDISPNHGYSFPCTKDGKVLLDKLSYLATENYTNCLSEKVKTILPPYIIQRAYKIIHPRIYECIECGEEITDHIDEVRIDSSLRCECGAVYYLPEESSDDDDEVEGYW